MKNEEHSFVNSTKGPMQYNIWKWNLPNAAKLGTDIFRAEEIDPQTHQQCNS